MDHEKRGNAACERLMPNITSWTCDCGVPSFDQYPFALPVLRDFTALELHPSVTFLVGENGSGKSTLMEAIATAWGFNPEDGTKNFRFATCASHSDLHEYLLLTKTFRRPKDGFFLRAESFFNVATEIDSLGAVQSYGGRSLHEQSHGESFLSLMMQRFGGQGSPARRARSCAFAGTSTGDVATST